MPNIVSLLVIGGIQCVSSIPVNYVDTLKSNNLDNYYNNARLKQNALKLNVLSDATTEAKDEKDLVKAAETVVEDLKKDLEKDNTPENAAKLAAAEAALAGAQRLAGSSGSGSSEEAKGTDEEKGDPDYPDDKDVVIYQDLLKKVYGSAEEKKIDISDERYTEFIRTFTDLPSSTESDLETILKEEFEGEEEEEKEVEGSEKKGDDGKVVSANDPNPSAEAWFDFLNQKNADIKKNATKIKNEITDLASMSVVKKRLELLDGSGVKNEGDIDFNVIAIRHGESAWNRGKKDKFKLNSNFNGFNGFLNDAELTDKGIMDGFRSGIDMFFYQLEYPKVNIKKMFVSNLDRAIETGILGLYTYEKLKQAYDNDGALGKYEHDDGIQIIINANLQERSSMGGDASSCIRGFEKEKGDIKLNLKMEAAPADLKKPAALRKTSSRCKIDLNGNEFTIYYDKSYKLLSKLEGAFLKMDEIQDLYSKIVKDPHIRALNWPKRQRNSKQQTSGRIKEALNDAKTEGFVPGTKNEVIIFSGHSSHLRQMMQNHVNANEGECKEYLTHKIHNGKSVGLKLTEEGGEFVIDQCVCLGNKDDHNYCTSAS